MALMMAYSTQINVPESVILRGAYERKVVKVDAGLKIGNTMNILGLILSTLVILWWPFATASQAEFSSIDAFLKANLKAEDKLSLEARGDLNGDGLEDWAGVIERQKSEHERTTQLYALLRLGQGGYRVAEKSQEEPISGAGCCWVEDLEITRSSVYIQNNAKDGDNMRTATHQFKLHQGEWRLIGVRITDLEISSDTSIETDMNLLTGAVIEKRQKGENKPLTKSRRQKFSASLLKDYDFSHTFGTK
jgi:hypothetical protein